MTMNWKTIDEFDGYSVSEYGDIKSVKKFRKDKILKSRINMHGYRQLGLWISSQRKQVTMSVHSLVARTFVPNPNNYPMVNHIDCNKLNNHYTNLEWCTASENIIHAVVNDLSGSSKLTTDDVRQIRQLIPSLSCKEIASKYGVTPTAIRDIKRKRTWYGI